MAKQKVLVVVEIDLGRPLPGDDRDGVTQAAFDTFRERVRPNEYGVTMYRATHADVTEFGEWGASGMDIVSSIPAE